MHTKTAMEIVLEISRRLGQLQRHVDRSKPYCGMTEGSYCVLLELHYLSCFAEDRIEELDHDLQGIVTEGS